MEIRLHQELKLKPLTLVVLRIVFKGKDEFLQLFQGITIDRLNQPFKNYVIICQENLS